MPPSFMPKGQSVSFPLPAILTCSCHTVLTHPLAVLGWPDFSHGMLFLKTLITALAMLLFPPRASMSRYWRHTTFRLLHDSHCQKIFMDLEIWALRKLDG